MTEKIAKPHLRFAGFDDTWEQRKLGDIVGIYDGVHQTPNYQNSGVMFLSVENIATLKSSKFISEEDFKRDYKVYPQENDILMTRIGDVGTTNVVTDNGLKAYYVSLALLKYNSTDPYFLSNAIQSDYVQKGLANRTLKTAIPMKINKDEIGKVSVMLPLSATEQQQIGKYFRSLDHLITLHQRKYDKLTNVKKSMLEKMFPKNGSNVPEIRFKGFSDAWEQRKLGDIVERVVRKNTNNESSLPLTISAQYGLVDQITYFNNRVASRDVSNYYLVLNGEFAYNKSTSDGFPFGAVKRLDLYEKGVLSTLYIVFSIKNQSEIDSDYLTVFFDTDRWHKGVSERAAEGARNHGLLNISADDFFDIDIFLPVHKEEQVVIGSYLRHLDNLITLHQRELEKLKNLKKACLEKMFV